MSLHDCTPKHVRGACAVCAQPSTSVCGRCRARAYCSQACQRSEWALHKALCASSVSAAAESERPLFLVLETRGEGELRGFYDLQAAEAHALATNGDIRRPCDKEKAANGMMAAAGSMAAMFTSMAGKPPGSRGDVFVMSHPAYMRPVSATADFIVRGRPSRVVAVFCVSCGCIMYVAAVFAGPDAQAQADAEAAKRNKERGVAVDANGDKYGDEWVTDPVTVV